MKIREDALQTRTNEVTDALRRTTQTMQAELERSVLSVQMLGTYTFLSAESCPTRPATDQQRTLQKPCDPLQISTTPTPPSLKPLVN